MNIGCVHLACFSATYTTRKIAELILEPINAPIIRYDLTENIPDKTIFLNKEDLFVIAVPVYAGRVPAKAAEALRMFRGENTPAVLVCVYGNREYDDALLELKDIAKEGAFGIVSAGVFIAQHSIFPRMAAGRPDATDMKIIRDFSKKTAELIARIPDVSVLPEIQVKGNYPYKVPGVIPLHPTGGKKCNVCGSCVRLCPVHAIPENDPCSTDPQKCISCGRCVQICPQHARRFRGLAYRIVAWKFTRNYSARKEPELFYAL